MPFGLNIGPLSFTRLTKSILKELHVKGIQVLVYLDNWLIWAKSKEECEWAKRLTLKGILKRGFLVNREKSSLDPSQTFVWIGLQWETRSATLALPNKTRRDIRNSVRHFLSRPLVSRRDLERVMEKLQFASIVNPLCKTLLKEVNLFLRGKAKLRLLDRKFP